MSRIIWQKIGTIYGFTIHRPFDPRLPAFLYDTTHQLQEDKREFVYKLCLWMEIEGKSAIEAKNILWHLQNPTQSNIYDKITAEITSQRIDTAAQEEKQGTTDR